MQKIGGLVVVGGVGQKAPFDILRQATHFFSKIYALFKHAFQVGILSKLSLLRAI